MTSLPGYAGLPVLGDKSVQFYRDPVGFVNAKVEQHGSPVFQSRFLNKPTVFLASNAAVREMLIGHLTFTMKLLFTSPCDVR